MRAVKLWTTAEEQILRQSYPYYTAQVMADRLGRTLYAVKVHAARLGLKRVHNFKHTGGCPPTCVRGACKVCKNRVRRHRWRAKLKSTV
jgi:hypothetical protein